MTEVFIFLIIVGVGAVVFLVTQSGVGRLAIVRFTPRSARSAGSAGSPQSPNFRNEVGSFYPKDGSLKSNNFSNVDRRNGVLEVVRPSGDYTGLFRGQGGTPQPVGRQVYGLPADKIPVDKAGAPPLGMTQAVYARKLAAANPKIAAEIIKQWIRSS